MPKHGEHWIMLSSVDVTHVFLPVWSRIGDKTGLFSQKAFSEAVHVESSLSFGWERTGWMKL